MWRGNYDDVGIQGLVGFANRKMNELEISPRERSMYGLAEGKEGDIALGNDFAGFVSEYGAEIREQFGLSVVLRPDKAANKIGIAKRLRDASGVPAYEFIPGYTAVRRALLLLMLWDGQRIIPSGQETPTPTPNAG